MRKLAVERVEAFVEQPKVFRLQPRVAAIERAVGGVGELVADRLRLAKVDRHRLQHEATFAQKRATIIEKTIDANDMITGKDEHSLSDCVVAREARGADGVVANSAERLDTGAEVVVGGRRSRMLRVIDALEIAKSILATTIGRVACRSDRVGHQDLIPLLGPIVTHHRALATFGTDYSKLPVAQVATIGAVNKKVQLS